MKRETLERLMARWLQDPCPGCGSDLHELFRESWAELAHDYQEEGLDEHAFHDECPYCGEALVIKVDVSLSFVCELNDEGGPADAELTE